MYHGEPWAVFIMEDEPIVSTLWMQNVPTARRIRLPNGRTFIVDELERPKGSLRPSPAAVQDLLFNRTKVYAHNEKISEPFDLGE